MVATVNLFFDNVVIGDEEAPQRVLEAQRRASSYDAVLKKRFGRITADDFLKYARRLTILCNEIYQGSKLELLKNKSIPLGFAVFVASQGLYEGYSGEVIDINQLSADSFRKMFEHSSSMILNIRPNVRNRDIFSSFTQIAWTRGRLKTIFFYAQQGRSYYCSENHGPLEDLLLRKLFYVPGVAPSLNFAVKLGLKAHFDEAEGKLF